MNGMTPQDFERKLKKLNKWLRVDHTRIAYPYSRDYPTCGLYHDQQFIIGVAQKFQPEYTVAGVDLSHLEKRDEFELIEEILETGFIPDDLKERIPEKILWRGYKSILSHLCRINLINREEAQKAFRCEIFPLKLEYPRNYINFPT